MWYKRLSELLSFKGYTNNDDYTCVFIKKSSTGFCIISVCVDDLNITKNETNINEARHHLKTEFWNKGFGLNQILLSFATWAFTIRDICILSGLYPKVLEKFNMDESYESKTHMVVRLLDMEKNTFRPRGDGEEILGLEYPYLSIIDALMI